MTALSMVAAVRAACDPISDKRGPGIQDQAAGHRAPRRVEGTSKGKGKLMAKKVHVTTTVNGDEYEYLAEAGQTLVDVLRNELELTGTKEGCSTGDCGACSVIVDGELVCSCLVLAAETDGKSVETIEGMANGDELPAAKELS